MILFNSYKKAETIITKTIPTPVPVPAPVVKVAEPKKEVEVKAIVELKKDEPIVVAKEVPKKKRVTVVEKL
jgi:hypothetical protein